MGQSLESRDLPHFREGLVLGEESERCLRIKDKVGCGHWRFVGGSAVGVTRVSLGAFKCGFSDLGVLQPEDDGLSFAAVNRGGPVTM